MKKLLLIICILTGFQLTSRAQLAVSPHIVPAFPTGSFGNVVSTGFGFGLEATYAVHNRVRIGAAIDRYNFEVEPFNLDLGGIFNTMGNVNFNLTPITGTVQYLLPGSAVFPYVGLEAGAYTVSASMGIAGFTRIDINRTYFGLAPALGIIYPLNERFALYANAKYQTIFVGENIDVPLLESIGLPDNTVHFIPISVGVSFNFVN